MGSFLDKPVMEKEVVECAGNGLRCAVSAMQGWRAGQEDAHTLAPRMPGQEDHAFFAVYDGHGGEQSAVYASEHMIPCVTSTHEWERYAACEDNASGDAAVLVGRALRRAFLDCDAQMRARPEACSEASGCTAVAAIISPHFIVVANAGDSRCVLARDGGAQPMSFDHKPFMERERERIEAAGGCVTRRRVNGDLAVSRALGDYSYKQSAELPAEAQQVSAEPDIEIQRRDGTEEFLLIACDGIWDVLSNQQAVEYVRQNLRCYMQPRLPLANATSDLVDTCFVKGSRDNMSALLVGFADEGLLQIATEPTEWERILPLLGEDE
eukprot:g2280.t1